MSKIVALTGAIGSGKNTLASAAVSSFQNTKDIAFADLLKDSIQHIFNLPSREAYEVFKRGEFGGISGRHLVREIGMLMRGIHEEVFVQDLRARVEADSTKHYIVTDLRFQNEYEALQDLKRGGHKVLVVEIIREGLGSSNQNSNLQHISEAGFSKSQIDLTITNSDLEGAKASFIKLCRELNFT
jgi:dephospho-CoA kinase